MTPPITLDDKTLLKIEGVLGVKFSNRDLLRTAFTHESFSKENKTLKMESNQRLEFLGDSVLNFVVSRFLYGVLPDNSEGDLTKRKIQAVRGETIAEIAGNMRLGEYLVMGVGQKRAGGAYRTSILEDLFEAVIGAILLDAGLEAASDFINSSLSEELLSITRSMPPMDPKSLLQELVQSKSLKTPEYRVINSSGSEHKPLFTCEVIIDGNSFGRGIGKRKIEAERAAATEAYTRFEKE